MITPLDVPQRIIWSEVKKPLISILNKHVPIVVSKHVENNITMGIDSQLHNQIFRQIKWNLKV